MELPEPVEQLVAVRPEVVELPEAAGQLGVESLEAVVPVAFEQLVVAGPLEVAVVRLAAVEPFVEVVRLEVEQLVVAAPLVAEPPVAVEQR